MDRKPKRSVTDKVIHIRIDEETHRKLKMHAASSKATIQKLVEDLIRSKYRKMRIRNEEP
jgi:predicted HicB family RNase H-like nuclease